MISTRAAGKLHRIEPNMSVPPQAPGPIRRGIEVTAAMPASWRSQSAGSAVTAASAGGRGRGSGTAAATAAYAGQAAAVTASRPE